MTVQCESLAFPLLKKNARILPAEPSRSVKLLLVSTLLLFIACQSEGGRGTPRAAVDLTSPTITSTNSFPTAKVVKVIDGDTVELEDRSRVRYIGVDTPETVAPGQPVGCFGREASAFNKQLVEGKVVGLEKDVSEKDRFDR